jgi:hypothetical protein
MLLGFPSLRVDLTNPLHHLWCNNGTWWVHSTLHYGVRKQRIRRSLGTAEVSLAVQRWDDLLARLAAVGEIVPERSLRHVNGCCSPLPPGVDTVWHPSPGAAVGRVVERHGRETEGHAER